MDDNNKPDLADIIGDSNVDNKKKDDLTNYIDDT